MADGPIAAFSRLASRAALAVSVAGLTLMTLIIGWQVFARYVLNASPSWSEQAALLLMLYFLLFAAAVGIREGFHIRITLLEDSLSPKRRKWLRLANHLCVGLFGFAMAAGGIELIGITASHSISTLGISRAFAFAPMAGAGLLILFFSLEHILAETRGRKVEPIWS